MTKKELERLGWHTYYNPAYWVHPKTVQDPKRQDYTNYGMSFAEAVEYERKGCPRFSPVGDLAAAIRVCGSTSR